MKNCTVSKVKKRCPSDLRSITLRSPVRKMRVAMNRREVLSGTTMAAVILALPSEGRAGGRSLRDRLVGAWSLVEIYDKGKDGSHYYVWGEGVQGLAIYTPGGHISLQIISANRDKAASKNPRAPVGQSIGYFGTYTADEATMTINVKIDRCSFPGWDGAERVSKIVSLTDDELRTEGATFQDPVHGDVAAHAQYKRVG
jgi:hypothetical protein